MANYGTLPKGFFFFLFFLFNLLLTNFFYNVISHFQGDVLKETAKVHFFLIFSAIIWRLIFVTISSQSVSEEKILTNPKRLEQKNNVMKVMRNNVVKAISMSPVFPFKESGHDTVIPGQSRPAESTGASVFATLSLRGRPGQDGCQSALWDCFGRRIFNMAAVLPPKQSRNALWQPSRPGLPGNFKVANIWEKMLTLWPNQQHSGVLWLSKTSPVHALIDSPWTSWSGLASQSV